MTNALPKDWQEIALELLRQAGPDVRSDNLKQDVKEIESVAREIWRGTFTEVERLQWSYNHANERVAKARVILAEREGERDAVEGELGAAQAEAAKAWAELKSEGE